jgi:hypothetical protein
MMQYAQQPQNILAVIYDGCVIFKQSLSRLWPLCVLLFVFHAWLFISSKLGVAHYSAVMADDQPLSWFRLLYSSRMDMAQLLHSINSLVTALVIYLVLAMVWAAIDAYTKQGMFTWSDIFLRLRHRGPALILQWMILGLLIVTGFSMLVLPGLVMYVLFYQARFYLFLEGFGPLRSLRESAQLVWGTSWWRTFALYALVCLCYLPLVYASYKLLTYQAGWHAYLGYAAYVGLGVINVLLEVLIASWQLALFNDLKLRWVLPASEGGINNPAT